ncbi:GHKL domain-containing protein [Candidatus Roizmanbacteria bacterium]|nr:GHKL domain-containing protein [Candidatus Roizmanbacteria bacterium]
MRITYLYVIRIIIILMKFIDTLYSRLYCCLFLPTSSHPDDMRRESILNILLVGSIGVAGIAVLNNCVTHLMNVESSKAVPPSFAIVFVFLLVILLYISRKGGYKIVSYILIFIGLFVSSLTIIHWGISVPSALLTYSLMIIMSGILLSSRVAFFVSFMIAGIMVIINYLQNYQLLPVDYSWKQHAATISDALSYSFVFLIIALISWLFNRESEKALERARASEAELKKERDLLEIKVEERTQELKRVQIEEISQLYRFVEMGKITSGLLHDLVNPLNVVSLNLELLKVQSKRIDTQKTEEITESIHTASLGAKRLEKFIYNARRQLQNQDVVKVFSVDQEIEDTLKLLEHKTKKERIEVIYTPEKSFFVKGNPIKFSQVILNVVSNAIDAYEGVSAGEEQHTIAIHVIQKKLGIVCTVQDWGKGISTSEIPLLFDPFYTTKGFEKGSGIGLSICKEVIEHDFKGTITVESTQEKGTIFTITIPIDQYGS